MQTTYVDKGSTLDALAKEWNARGNAWIIKDRHKKFILLCQALKNASAFISDFDVAVSATALYNGARRQSSVHFRWQVEEHDLETAVISFERDRDAFEHTVLLGNRNCYVLS